MDENEPLDHAAARELQEETSVNPKDVLLTQIGAFGDPGRWERLAGTAACSRRHMAVLLGCPSVLHMKPALLLLGRLKALAAFA